MTGVSAEKPDIKTQIVAVFGSIEHADHYASAAEASCSHHLKCASR
jgi:hypothetical protein